MSDPRSVDEIRVDLENARNHQHSAEEQFGSMSNQELRNHLRDLALPDVTDQTIRTAAKPALMQLVMASYDREVEELEAELQLDGGEAVDPMIIEAEEGVLETEASESVQDRIEREQVAAPKPPRQSTSAPSIDQTSRGSRMAQMTRLNARTKDRVIARVIDLLAVDGNPVDHEHPFEFASDDSGLIVIANGRVYKLMANYVTYFIRPYTEDESSALLEKVAQSLTSKVLPETETELANQADA